MFDCEWRGEYFEVESKLTPFVDCPDFGPRDVLGGVSGAAVPNMLGSAERLQRSPEPLCAVI